MSSLDHLLCPDTTARKLSNHSLHYSDPSDFRLSDTSSKPNSRRCCIPDCQKTAKRGGRCISHGGGNKCAVDGCTTSVVSRGLCVAHGGGKRCQTQGCTKSAQSGGFCWVHGGGKKCGYHGCSKRAQSGGACIAHGGGKRCRIDRCNKVVQYDGLCVGHGGYRRCVFENCNKRAMANDFCQHHGGSSVCLLDHCFKRAVRGGMCSEHKAEASMQLMNGSGLPGTTHSDEDRVNKSQWRNKFQEGEASRKSSPTPRTSNVRSYKDIATRSPSPVRSVRQHRDNFQRADSPKVPGFSALLNANDTFPSFASSYTRKPDLSEPFVRRQHHQEHKVFPLLPSIQSLPNYHSRVSSVDKSPHTRFADSVATPVRPELRIVVTEDRDRSRQAPSTEIEYREEEDYKLYVHSYYYQRNEGALPFSTPSTRRHAWGR
ncbi:hypothetical protein F442_10942 [Phytophthora nicotianae P10297]|uniref:WRKY19-like zinc finger domain-containing protein n=1 Tax=Phytophthora nicotianae P10297 TaxID=1317064 RepID=W2Z7D8_PHYNI|nr:hypothetical protein F442_10942 [Phytophthora nicotianae P10297]